MSRERAERERLSSNAGLQVPLGIEGTVDDPKLGGMNIFRDPRNPPGTDEVMAKAERSAERSRRRSPHEDEVPERSLTTVKSPGDPSTEAATLPVIGEAAESASNTSRHVTPSQSREEVQPRAMQPSEGVGEAPPPTPPKMDGSLDRRSAEERRSWGGIPPPTPPKDSSRIVDKELPLPPFHQARTRIGDDDDDFGLSMKRS